MAILRDTRKIDSRGRVTIPPQALEALNFKPGDDVYYEITKAGSLVIKKASEK